jgi:hypothetical protein
MNGKVKIKKVAKKKTDDDELRDVVNELPTNQPDKELS